jgi:hypothetical protein
MLFSFQGSTWVTKRPRTTQGGHQQGRSASALAPELPIVYVSVVEDEDTLQHRVALVLAPFAWRHGHCAHIVTNRGRSIKQMLTLGCNNGAWLVTRGSEAVKTGNNDGSPEHVTVRIRVQPFPVFLTIAELPHIPTYQPRQLAVTRSR